MEPASRRDRPNRRTSTFVRGFFFFFSGFLDLHVPELFGIEDLAALQALDILGVFVPGDDSYPGMFADGRHLLMWIVTANQKNEVPRGSVHCRRLHRPADEDFAFGSPGITVAPASTFRG
jgi:hypothetical protein